MRMYLTNAAVAAVVGLVWSPLTALAATPVTVLAKPGGTLAAREIDEAECKLQAQATRNTNYAEGPGGSSGVAPALIIQVMSDGNIVSRAERACLGARGWATVSLTADEARQYSNLRGTTRDAWLEAFFAGSIGDRVAAALPLPFTPLPAAVVGRGFVGGLLIDPDRIEVVSAPLRAKDILVRGVAMHQATATLIRPLDVEAGFGHLRAPAGTVFHQVILPSRSGLRAAWCGQAEHAMMHCFLNHVESYDLTVGRGRSWLFARTFTSAEQELDTLRTVSPIWLQLDETDKLGPVDYMIRIAALNDKRVKLEAVARRGEEEVVFWTGAIDFDAAGKAILPFWTKKLILTRSDGTVQARLEDTGNGEGWPW